MYSAVYYVNFLGKHLKRLEKCSTNKNIIIIIIINKVYYFFVRADHGKIIN